MSRALVMLSGGMDSAVVLAQALKFYDEVETVFFTYGQEASWNEINQAHCVCSHYHLPMPTEIRLSDVFRTSKSSLVNCKVPIKEGTYEQQGDKVPTSVVENRNMVFISAAVSLAMQWDCDIVLTGIRYPASKYGYADCSREFVEVMSKLAQNVSQGAVRVIAPLGDMTREQVIKLGLELRAPLSLTWSCYNTHFSKPCGKCAPCIDRAQAFAKLGMKDPALVMDV